MSISPTLTSAEPAIEIARLTKSYPIPGRRSEAVQALRGVSVSLPRGSFTAVVGASGSGKSTLLHCAAGLDRPTSGGVRLLGHPMTGLRPARLADFRRAHVGFIFQDYNLVSSLSAADNVSLPSRLAGRTVPRSEVHAALDAVGLVHRAGQRPHQLSGGERQRVAIARVMVSSPEIVFADEPTGALDVDSGARVLGWLEQIAARGTTVMVVTHDVTAASRAGEVLVMHAGLLAGRVPGGDEDRVGDALARARHQPSCTTLPAMTAVAR